MTGAAATGVATTDTVEQVVRRQLSRSLGGRRGMVEAAVPGLVFTAAYLLTSPHDLTLALILSGASAGAFLVARLVQRSTIQFCLNALVGIAIGWVFTRWAGSAGGSQDHQALAFFLPGILYSLVYSVVLAASCLARWPLVGFMLGAALEDPLSWHGDRQVVQLCSRLTWVLGAPGMIGVLLQGPVWLMGWRGAMSAETAVVVISGLRYGLGWALRLGSAALILWLLGRNHTPVQDSGSLHEALEPHDERVSEA